MISPHLFCLRGFRLVPALIGVLASLVLATCTQSVWAFQSPAQKSAVEQQVMIRGLTFMRTGFPDKAVAVFSEGLKISPNNPDLLSAMADAQALNGDISMAIFYLDRAIKLDPGNLFLNRQALRLTLESGDARSAVARSSRLLELNPTDPQDHISHLALLERLQQREPAAVAAREALSRFPNDQGILEAVIDVFMEAGHVDSASNAARRLADITQDPDDWTDLAAIWIQADRIDLAKEALEEALSLDPDHEPAIQIRSSLDKENPALSGQQRAESVEGGEMGVIESIPALFEAGRYEQALKLATQHIEQDPRKLDLWVYALKAGLQLGELDEAATMAEDGLLLFPGYAPLLYQYALILFKQQRFPEAATAARSALEGAAADSDLKSSIEALLSELQQFQ